MAADFVVKSVHDSGAVRCGSRASWSSGAERGLTQQVQLDGDNRGFLQLLPGAGEVGRIIQMEGIGGPAGNALVDVASHEVIASAPQEDIPVPICKSTAR